MDTSIATIIPCYRVRDHIVEVVGKVPPWIKHIFVVDDACPQQSGRYLQQNCTDPRVQVIFLDANRGVGAAMISGYRAALAAGCDIMVKIDGDGQMDPQHLPRLLNPIRLGIADFTKGNRFYDLQALRQMPLVRRIGNFGLTLLTKVASGHWHVSDPTNGYIAIHRTALQLLNTNKLAHRYFFETSLLIQLNIIRAVTMEVPMPARYGPESSSLNVWRSLFGFPPKLAAGLAQRLLWRYFIFDINAVTILLLTGALTLTGGAGFGLYRWHLGAVEGQAQTTGTVALALLPIIVGFQMLLQAMLLDVVDKPPAPLSMRIRDDWETYA